MIQHVAFHAPALSHHDSVKGLREFSIFLHTKKRDSSCSAQFNVNKITLIFFFNVMV